MHVYISLLGLDLSFSKIDQRYISQFTVSNNRLGNYLPRIDLIRYIAATVGDKKRGRSLLKNIKMRPRIKYLYLE